MSKKGFSFDLDEAPKKTAPKVAFVPEPADKTSRFILSSAILHGALMGALMIFSLPMFQPPKTETITIELADSAPAPKALAKQDEPAAQPEQQQPAEEVKAEAPAETQETQRAEAPKQQETVQEQAQLEEPEEIPALAAPVVVAKAPKIKSAPKAAAKVVAPTPTVAQSPVEIPQNLDAEETAAIDDSQFDSKVDAKLEDGELDSSLAQVEGKMTPGVNAPDLQKDADQEEQEDLAKADAADQDTKAKSKLLAAQTDALKKKNANALAAMQAAQAAEAAAALKAAQQKAGQEKAARDAAIAAANAKAAAEKAMAAKAAAQAARINGKSTSALANRDGNVNGNGVGNGNGNGNVNGSPSVVAGIPAGQIRKLDQLKQMPGNPRPAYADAERMSQQQGDAVYLAYINKQGQPTNFKQLRSTGYANLDAKTLSALRQWKFVPGQEGWVEIPFRWDLKGGPQERSALARRNAGITLDRGSLRTQ